VAFSGHEDTKSRKQHLYRLASCFRAFVATGVATELSPRLGPLTAWLLGIASLVVTAAAAGPDVRLIDAVKAGNVEGVRALLRQQVDVNAREADGTTALHWAVRSDAVDIALSLIRAGAAPDTTNRYGVSPLILAATNGNALVIEALMKAGADPNHAMPEGQTVLMAAARTGKVAAVRALLRGGADPNVHERRLGETALMWAAAENHGEAAAALVEQGADVNATSNPADFPRFSFGDGIVALMMTLPRGHWTPMMYAARQGAVEAIRVLVAVGADPNLTDPEGTTALMLAINNAHYDVATLLAERADPNVADVTGMTALYAAVNMNTLGDLPGRPAPRPTGRMTAVDVARTLLAHGANPNARLDKPILQRQHSAGDGALGEGATPFLRAAKSGDVAMMRVLREHGADPALTTGNQTTAVIFAAGPASGGLGGSFPVSDADKIAAIQFSVEQGVDINAADGTGQTAMHIAARQSSPTIVAALVDRGARVDVKDKQGRTPIDVARGIGGRGQPVVRTEIVELLQRHAN
jgi:ankyrin repeat protein